MCSAGSSSAPADLDGGDEVAKACDIPKLALMASKGCVLVNWQPRRQQDEEATGDEASTGGADTEPSAQHVSRPNVAVAQAVQWRVVCRTVASAAVMAITK